MRKLIVLALLLMAPLASAHHPGSVGGLNAYEPPMQALVHRITDVQASFTEWESTYPNLVERRVIGATGTLDQPLEAIVLTDESVEFDAAATSLGHKYRIYLDGGHHGNEFLGVDIIMYYLEDILDEFSENPNFLQTHELYALPILNVEGNALDTRKNANQVDVNRNYAFQFGGPGSGGSITDLNYRGPSAFSEPEVLANAEFAREIRPDLWITMHSGVAEFYWPWGWTFDKSPDWEFFESLEQPFEAATNGRVDAMMAAELYLAAGATDDWGYGALGIPTHTYEVHEDQFVPIYGQPIPSIMADQIAGLDWMVKNTRYMGATMDLHEVNGTFHVYNAGWGRAENITVTWDGGEFIVPRLEPGQMHVFDPAPAQNYTVSYRQLLVNATEGQDRVQTYSMQQWIDIQEEPTVEESPLPILVMFAALAAALAVIRRR